MDRAIRMLHASAMLRITRFWTPRTPKRLQDPTFFASSAFGSCICLRVCRRVHFAVGDGNVTRISLARGIAAKRERWDNPMLRLEHFQ